MWQKCPICNGSGNHTQPYTNATSGLCKVCGGKGIINEITGLPPEGVETFASPKYRNPDGTPVIDESKVIKTNPPSLFVKVDTPWYNMVESYYNK